MQIEPWFLPLRQYHSDVTFGNTHNRKCSIFCQKVSSSCISETTHLKKFVLEHFGFNSVCRFDSNFKVSTDSDPILKAVILVAINGLFLQCQQTWVQFCVQVVV